MVSASGLSSTASLLIPASSLAPLTDILPSVISSLSNPLSRVQIQRFHPQKNPTLSSRIFLLVSASGLSSTASLLIPASSLAPLTDILPSVISSLSNPLSRVQIQRFHPQKNPTLSSRIFLLVSASGFEPETL